MDKNVFMKRDQNVQKYFVETVQKRLNCEERGSAEK